MEFNFSGKESDFKNLLRQFTLDQLLVNINKESARLLTSILKSDIPGIKHATFPLINSITRNKHTQDVFITGWNLIDLAFSAISCSNDYRGHAINKDEELYLLISATQAMHESREQQRMDHENLDANPNIFLYLSGFFGEQKKFQQPRKVFENLSRELYMLLELSPQLPNISNIKEIVYAEMGVSVQKVILALFLSWFASTQSSFQQDWEQTLLWDESLTLAEFQSIISSYTATYKDVRSSTLGRQFLYTKPYIRTQNKEVISINCFLNFFLIEHCILWCVRNYYLHSDDQRFTSEFGLIFEAYFKELLSHTLKDNQYERITEEATKRADWKVTLGKYKFLVEQKSPLLGLPARQQESDLSATKAFCERNLLKGIKQLGNTEKDLGDGKYIKIILLYEDYLDTGLLDYVFTLSNCKYINDHYYWFVTIDEMETMLCLYNDNIELFNDIIDEKIRRETTLSNDGKSLSQIYGEKGIQKNPYLDQPKFQKYIDKVKDESLQHIKK